MGVITTKKSLVQLEKLSTASFCRRRLAVVMVRLKMSETLREACTFVEQVVYDREIDYPYLAVTADLGSTFRGIK
jgi:ribosomal protein S4